MARKTTQRIEGDMNNRRFGVEIECGSHQYNHYEIADLVRRNHIRGVLNTDEDGSGIELRTIPLRGKDGFKRLQEIMLFLGAQGCYTAGRDGLHVHHNAPEFVRSYTNQAKLVRGWYENREHINTFVAPNRRRNSHCPPWSDILVNQVEAAISDPDNADYDFEYHRGSLNLMSLGVHRTIEFRLHEGTLDFDKAEAWIKFGQYFIESSLKRTRPIACAESPEMLLRRIRAPKATTRLVGAFA